MEWLNYHHLLYFWTVVREGGITAASRQLKLAQPTVSGQLRQLELSLGEKLYVRRGRAIELTDVGRTVYRYADEIFTIGRELQDVVRGRPAGRPLRLAVGLADVVPKLVAHHLLEPALRGPTPVQLLVREDRPDRLVADLSVHELDLVLSDTPLDPQLNVRAFNHLLGETGVSFFAAPELALKLGRRFPGSLDGAPFLFPADGTALRRGLTTWFESLQVKPLPVAEIHDSALIKVFGQSGAGVFAMPSTIEKEVARQFRVRVLGRTDAVKERFYAISVERRLKHPVVVAITEAARGGMFAPPQPAP